MQKLNEHIKILKRRREKVTIYDFDFGIIDELESMATGEEERVIKEVKSIAKEVDVTVGQSSKKEKLETLLKLAREEANAPTKKTKKEYEKPIQKVVNALLDEEKREEKSPVPEDSSKPIKIDDVVNILVSYLREKGFDHDEKDVRSFVMKKIQHA